MGSSNSTPKLTRTVGTQTCERILGSGKRKRPLELDKGIQQLLPGIPDEITVDKICPKLPWHALKILYLVSTTWQKAIESHQVYRARLRTRSIEALVVHFHTNRIALYSSRDEECYELPPIPHLREQFPSSCECIGLDGKIYVSGGHEPGSHAGSAEVFVLDVAGNREWAQCASMQEPRMGFGCAISGGKIYVLGGKSHRLPVAVSEVYDPQVDSWSPIAPMPSFRCDHRVVPVGDKLLAYSGSFYYNPDWDPEFSEEEDARAFRPDVVEAAEYLEVYDTMKNEWGMVDETEQDPTEVVLVVKDKICALDDVDVHEYKFEAHSSTVQHIFSFPEYLITDGFEARTGLAVDNDLYATFS